jgi:glycosyltransferase involved in cell wall biosynthesis
MTTHNVLLVVPAWNEADSLPSLLTQLKEYCPQYDVLVVNDGSSDATTSTAKAHGAIVVELPCNLGIGGAVQTGFLYAQRYGYDAVVRLDADGQHPPEEVDHLLARLNVGDVDVVIGSRFLVQGPGFRSSRLRRIGINWLNFLLGSLTRQKITDCTSGFCAYGRKTVAFFATNYPQDYPEPEGIILLTRNGFRIVEIPVHMRERQTGISSIRGLKPVYYMIKVTLAVLIAFLRQPIRNRA